METSRNPSLGASSSRRAATQIRQVVHAETFGNLPQPGSAGGEEAAQQPAGGQLPHPRLPGLDVEWLGRVAPGNCSPGAPTDPEM